MKKRPFYIDIVDTFKPGDPPPEDYVGWDEWAQVQLKGGIRQERRPCCGLLKFPNEKCACEAKAKAGS